MPLGVFHTRRATVGHALADRGEQRVQLDVGAVEHHHVGIGDDADVRGRKLPSRPDPEEPHVRRRHAGAQQRVDDPRVVAQVEETAGSEREAFERIPRDARAPAATDGDDPAQALVSRTVAGQEHQAAFLAPRRAGAKIPAQLHPGDRAHAHMARGVMQPDLSGKGLHVGDRQRREPVLDGAPREILDRSRAEAQGVLTLDVQWNEHRARNGNMAEPRTGTSALEFLPTRASLPALREAVQGCRGCALYARATQAVFGEGRRSARVVMVGEQPGNEEDLQGHPFVGPAGRVLDRAMEAAGLDRADAYVTNVVKHFKWEARGSRRIHKKPGAREIGACLPWLEKEIELVRPEVLVLLGATAAQTLMGRAFKVTAHRGQVLESPLAPHAIATVHPSSILRAASSADRHREMERFTKDLQVVAALLNGHG